ncbi:MAG: zinc ribbon domain-containing protein [Methanohalobium sp.]
MDPAYTFQACNRCNHISKNNQSRLNFKCEICG